MGVFASRGRAVLVEVVRLRAWGLGYTVGASNKYKHDIGQSALPIN